MAICKNCGVCGKSFSVPKCRSDTAKYCSKDCADKGQATRTKLKLFCDACGKSFSAYADHGRQPRFCSRKCFSAKSPFAGLETKKTADGRLAVDRKCPCCGESFLATTTGHGLNVYCSKACANIGLRNGKTVECPNCNRSHYLIPSRAARGVLYCSQKCRTEGRRLMLSNAWKGGAYIRQDTDEQFVIRNIEEERIKTYVGMHRLVASFAIGRELERTEYVIRINRPDTKNNNPENLYICASIPEYCSYRDGTQPWPAKSNLDSYQARQN